MTVWIIHSIQYIKLEITTQLDLNSLKNYCFSFYNEITAFFLWIFCFLYRVNDNIRLLVFTREYSSGRIPAWPSVFTERSDYLIRKNVVSFPPLSTCLHVDIKNKQSQATLYPHPDKDMPHTLKVSDAWHYHRYRIRIYNHLKDWLQMFFLPVYMYFKSMRSS